MSTIIFKTEDAIFQFDQKSVFECLERRKLSYDIQELDDLIEVLSNQPKKTTLSFEQHRYFGFVAMDLINAGEGSVTCKNCDRAYLSNQLEAFTVEPPVNTFKAVAGKKGGFKNLFRKKPKTFGMYGGKGYKCPEGHQLIFQVTWRT